MLSVTAMIRHMNKQVWAGFAATACLAVAAVSAQDRAPAPQGDWITYGADLAGTKYTELAEITPANVGSLAQAWAVQLTQPPAGRRGGGAATQAAGAPSAAAVDPSGVAQLGSNPQATPIAVNGTMYLPAAGNSVLALDGDSGKEVWKFTLPTGTATTARGVAYWAGDSGARPRLLLTAGPRLFAIDAATGKPADGFGTDGSVDITVPWNGVPLVYRNVVMLGATTGEIPDGLPGDTRAFDARTGKKLWEFHTVPRAGEPGNQTWLNDGWKNRSGTNVWTWHMTLRRRARNPLHASRGSGRQLLGWRSSWRQPLRELDRRRRCDDGQISLAFPDGSSRPVGFGHVQSTDAR